MLGKEDLEPEPTSSKSSRLKLISLDPLYLPLLEWGFEVIPPSVESESESESSDTTVEAGSEVSTQVV